MHSSHIDPGDTAMTTTDAAARFLPLRPVEFDILLSLGRAPLHGYGIVQETEERSGGRVQLQLGTLYRGLRRMEEEGLIVEIDTPDHVAKEDERRRYYALTELGRAVAAAEIARMEALVREGHDRDLAGEKGRA